MFPLVPLPATDALGARLLDIARALPAPVPAPRALPSEARPGVALRLADPAPLRTAVTRATLGRVNGLRPEDPAWPVDGFTWIDADGAPVPGEVTTHDLLSVGEVQFPTGPVPVPGAWPSPGPAPLARDGARLDPVRVHAILRLAAACRDRQGLDYLLQPEAASVLVLDEDMVAPVAWVLTHVARITRALPGGRAERPLRLLVLRGGAANAAVLASALAEDARLVVLATGPLPDWPAGITPPDWLGLPPIDGALISRQIAVTWPGVPWGRDDPEATAALPDGLPDADWLMEWPLPPDEPLARLTAADIAAAFSTACPAHALHEINRRLGRA